eukprot:CAMPEP_0194417544 /NCGR_PEP_ID=MMETSP0176-20130528/16645_1 /TAXON_ID=216777 /ORGANISM="Proboscia alata, Strain PI-D3" /LENGTH=75 /DNA_ID=CAMNT_0039223507 /DNA_START=1828 /DNA_END=2051 /DNA_ORIENTATION=+
MPKIKLQVAHCTCMALHFVLLSLSPKGKTLLRSILMIRHASPLQFYSGTVFDVVQSEEDFLCQLLRFVGILIGKL